MRALRRRDRDDRPRDVTAKPLVLVGGAGGTGKTTLASRLCTELAIDHRLSTGFIREVVKQETTPAKAPELFRHTFEGADPVEETLRQSRRIHGAVVACIERAQREGISLVIEGVHLVPDLYAAFGGVTYVVLLAPLAEQHARQLRSEGHRDRPMSDADAARVAAIDRHYRAQSERLGGLVLGPSTVEERVAKVRARLERP